MDRYNRARAEIDRIIQNKVQYSQQTENKRLAFALKNEAQTLNNALINIEEHINEIKAAYEAQILNLRDKELSKNLMLVSLGLRLCQAKRTTKNINEIKARYETQILKLGDNEPLKKLMMDSLK